MASGSGGALRSLFANLPLVRVLGAYLFFAISEQAIWIGVILYAYAHGGTTLSGVIAIVQVAPCVLLAPVLATLADRYSPSRVFAIGLAIDCAGCLVALTAFTSGAPDVVVYGGALLANTAQVMIRPAQSVAIPGLAASAQQLAVCNAAVGWLENVGFVLAGIVVGIVFAVGSVGGVFLVCAVCTALGALLTMSLRTAPMRAESDDGPAGPIAEVRQGLEVVASRPEPRLLVGLILAEYVVSGATELLFVVIAVDMLHADDSWAGYFTTAFALGGVLAGVIVGFLVGRKLLRPLLAAGLMLSAALFLTTFAGGLPVALVLLVAAGAGRSVLDVSLRSLLQRTVPPDLLGRVFGLVEGAQDGGILLGSLLVPLLASLGGPKTALVGTSLVLPLAALLGFRILSRLDHAAQVPVAVIGLLRAMPHFRALPMPQLEGLARSVKPVQFRGGETIIRQGDPGDSFYAIASGRVDVAVDGEHVATRERPEGLGEIALLRHVPRTATVIADGPVELYELEGDVFVSVVSGHDATRRRAEAVATARLDSDGIAGEGAA